MQKMVSKTFNARVGFAIKYYRQQTLLRGSKGENKVVFRTQLAVISGMGTREDPKKERKETRIVRK